MEFIDTHTHIDIDIFDPTREFLLKQARNAGITAQLVAGIQASGWKKLLAICRKEPDLYPALGLHPLYSKKHRTEDLLLLSSLLREDQQRTITAIGEIGLDFFAENHEKVRQQRYFEDQLDIAASYNRPVLLHVRKAHDHVISALRRKKFPPGGIVHAFNGSMQQAHHYLDLGFVFGFGGTVTYTRAHKIRTLAQNIPLSAMVLETDTPDLPPQNHHGSINLPHYLLETARVIAELRQLPLAEIAAITSETAKKTLQIPPKGC